eukprot:4272559-Pyramimonas_sp.AAC.1
MSLRARPPRRWRICVDMASASGALAGGPRFERRPMSCSGLNASGHGPQSLWREPRSRSPSPGRASHRARGVSARWGRALTRMLTAVTRSGQGVVRPRGEQGAVPRSQVAGPRAAGCKGRCARNV